ncbi:hypothetical protein ACTVKE_14745 [Serratia marcescens]|uniref:hypothetical protein n=1 Tax=Serratia marcescens TaxID=615 RepID=UPI003FA6935A
MDNKLSELSRPTACRNKHTGRTFNATENTEPQIYESLYSQEYVSALLEDNERVARDLVARNGEIEGLRKRAAELESIRADASQVFKEIGNELGCNPDNESIMMAIDALKERLATPVRLPGSFYPDGGIDCPLVVELYGAIEAIRAAGFTVEGDE